MSKAIIVQFYTAFSNLDAEAMVDLYHENISFQDPAFGVLKGEKAKNMWRMLCASQKNKEFTVTFSNINYSNGIGTANWEAIYNFSKTGRKVHNKIKAQFEFKDGKIIKHTDVFDLHKWAKQALGFKGLLLGGTSFFKKKLNAQTNRYLLNFEKEAKKH